MTKQQTLDTLKTQLPGFYSVEQVIEMISKIEEPKTNIEFNEEQIATLIDSIVNEVTDLGADAIDDYELSMNYKEVELDSVDWNSREVKYATERAINDWIGQYKNEE
jgi:hypothetical protein